MCCWQLHSSFANSVQKQLLKTLRLFQIIRSLALATSPSFKRTFEFIYTELCDCGSVFIITHISVISVYQYIMEYVAWVYGAILYPM